MRRHDFRPRTLFPGGFSYAGESVTVDSLLLSAFVRPGHTHGVDLGCGAGILTLMQLWACPELRMDAVDIRPAAVETLRDNLVRNGWAERAALHTEDIRRFSLTGERPDFVITNPPYFPAGAGQTSPDGDRRQMHEESVPLSELCAIAAGLLPDGGSFYIVHLPRREAELRSAMEAALLHPVRRQVFASGEGDPPSLLLLEGQKGGTAPLINEPAVVQFTPEGRETAVYRKITHWEA